MGIGHVQETDGTVSLRPAQAGDVPGIVAARDEEFQKWLGPGSDSSNPAACVVVQGEVVGWVDYDHDIGHHWLDEAEVNVGYFVFAEHRGKGYAARATRLLLRHLSGKTGYQVASLLIDPGNRPSLAVARRCGFAFSAELGGQLYFRQALR